MGWGEAHGGVVHGAGTTGQIAEAHRALDSLGVERGNLAQRAIALTAQVYDLNKTLADLQERVVRLESATASSAAG